MTCFLRSFFLLLFSCMDVSRGSHPSLAAVSRGDIRWFIDFSPLMTTFVCLSTTDKWSSHTIWAWGHWRLGIHMHACMNAQSLLITYFDAQSVLITYIVCAIRWSVMHTRQSVKNPFWVFYGPRDLSQIAASPPLLQPDSRRMAVTITNDQTDEHLLQRFSRAPS